MAYTDDKNRGTAGGPLRCSFCGTLREATSFPEAPTATGRGSRCLECSGRPQAPAPARRRAMPDNPWLVKARKEREAKRLKYLRENEDPRKRAAWNAVRDALKTGKLKRRRCESCSGWPVTAHHHKGYDPEHRLNVVWLCRKCHQVENTRTKQKQAREAARQQVEDAPGLVKLGDREGGGETPG